MVTKATPKKSRWATLKAEALKEYEPSPPYLFDAVDPPIEIKSPDSIEQTLALASLLDSSGAISERDFKSLLQTICGKSFPAVWAVLADEPAGVLMPFINDLSDHFSATPPETEGLPGKE
jgi:hypothetical protein